jgi:hypothetical protein
VYGDPRFAVGVHPLQAFLSAMQLKCADFSPAARNVLERGYALAGQKRGVYRFTFIRRAGAGNGQPVAKPLTG